MAIEKEVLDQLLAGRDPDEVFAKDGLLDDLKKALSERILNAELDAHLEDERDGGSANRRNGASKKSVLTGTSKMRLDDPPRSLRHLRSEADRQIPAPLSRFRRQDHLHVCARHERARDPRPPGGALRHRRVAGPDLGRHRCRAGGSGRVAEPAAGRLLSAGLLRRHPGQDQGRGLRQEQGRLHRARHPGGRHEGDSRHLDRTDRGRQVLAAGS